MTPFQELRSKPLPHEHAIQNEVSFRLYPVDLSRKESAEPLVDVEEAGLASESFYARTDGLNAPYYAPVGGSLQRVWLRKGIVERLQRVNARLSDDGLELFLLDGYRREECQTAIYHCFYGIVKRNHPEASEDTLQEIVGNYISRPSNLTFDDPTTWFSHATGAAVDLTIRRKGTGEFLYMGAVFDDPSELSHTRYFEENSDATASAAEALVNRRLLFWLMREEGFANLPSEWWHFDYGNQLWAKNRTIWEPGLEPTTAWYGAMQSPE